jgi:hypothetical protein
MQIPIMAGREFTARDHLGAPDVVVVNRQFATAFGLNNPIGRTLTFHDGKVRYEIVGVVDNALTFFLKGGTRAAIYFPYMQGARAPGEMTYEIRSAGNPLDLAGPVRDVVHEIDSRLAIHDMKTQTEHIDQAISTEITLPGSARLSPSSRSSSRASVCTARSRSTWHAGRPRSASGPRSARRRAASCG